MPFTQTTWTCRATRDFSGSNVYMLAMAHEPELVKIGAATSVEVRLNDFKTANPYELVVLASNQSCCRRCAHAVESTLHRVLSVAGFHHRYEWFRLPTNVRTRVVAFITAGEWPFAENMYLADRPLALLLEL